MAPSPSDRSSDVASDDAPRSSGTADPRDRRVALLVGALVLAALVLRLPTAGVQSLWVDEAYTGRIVDGSLGHAWSTIQRTENTPPLFYLADWLWTRAFGTGELGLRSLSALAGALTVVPVVALARWTGGTGRSVPAAGMASRADRVRAWLADGLGRGSAAGPLPAGVPLAAGALLAVNPLAQWFSQEARSYALFVLLAAIAWLALLRAAVAPTRGRLALWALAATAVAWTHYFGGLLLVVGWATIGASALGAAPAGRRLGALRPLIVPAGLSAIAVAALVPIAARQQSTDMYRSISLIKGLGARIVEAPKQFAIGYDAPVELVLGGLLAVVLASLVLAGAWPRDGRATRGTLLLALVVAVWALPMLALVGGFDVVLTRNLVLLIPPLAVLAALGAWRLGRRGVVTLAAIGVVQLAVIVAVAVTPVYQREDWRGMLASAGDGERRPQLLFVQEYQQPAATYYAPTLVDVPIGATVAVRSVATIERPKQGEALGRIAPPPAPPGFTLARADQRDQWRVFVWRAPVPTALPADLLNQLRLQPPRAAVVRP